MSDTTGIVIADNQIENPTIAPQNVDMKSYITQENLDRLLAISGFSFRDFGTGIAAILHTSSSIPLAERILTQIDGVVSLMANGLFNEYQVKNMEISLELEKAFITEAKDFVIKYLQYTTGIDLNG